MSENLLSKIIAEQTEILLKNINSVVQSANLEAEFDGLNASRFIFHTLHSLDKWFVNTNMMKILLAVSLKILVSFQVTVRVLMLRRALLFLVKIWKNMQCRLLKKSESILQNFRIKCFQKN